MEKHSATFLQQFMFFESFSSENNVSTYASRPTLTISKMQRNVVTILGESKT